MESQEMTRLEVLLCLLYDDEDSCSVSGMARVLQKEKYMISRMLKSMEAEGLVDRSDNRRPRLTPKGRLLAVEYDDKVNVSINHLLYEGVDAANARHDAIVWAIHNSAQTMDVIRKAEARCQVKYELRNEHPLTGSFCASICRMAIMHFPSWCIRGRRQTEISSRWPMPASNIPVS